MVLKKQNRTQQSKHATTMEKLQKMQKLKPLKHVRPLLTGQWSDRMLPLTFCLFSWSNIISTYTAKNSAAKKTKPQSSAKKNRKHKLNTNRNSAELSPDLTWLNGRQTVLLLLLLLHPFNGLFSRTTWVSRYQNGKTSLDLNEARDDGKFWDAVTSAGPYDTNTYATNI